MTHFRKDSDGNYTLMNGDVEGARYRDARPGDAPDGALSFYDPADFVPRQVVRL